MNKGNEMKTSELIKILLDVLVEYGDLECMRMDEGLVASITMHGITHEGNDRNKKAKQVILG